MKKTYQSYRKCRHWFMDGTFSVCSLIFQPSIDQIFTLRSVQKAIINYFAIHEMYSCQIIPLLYALLIGKETNDDNKFFEQLLLKHDYKPESILVDFENATLKSTKTMFPDAIQFSSFELYAFFSKKTAAMNLGCFFSILDSVSDMKYNHQISKASTPTTKKVRINVKKLMGLTYAAVSDAIEAYSSIATDFDVEDNDLLNYFERVWV